MINLGTEKVKYSQKNRLKRIVYALIVLFILNLLNSFVPPPYGIVFLPFSLVYIVLGIVLIFLTLKSGVERKLRVFLLLTGFSSAGLVLGFLHGFFAILGFEIVDVILFYLAVIVAPILFLIGAIGSIVMFRKKGGWHSSHS